MATAEIIFEDAEDGVVMTLHFTDELPEDPADATEAQVSAMLAFQQFLGVTQEDEEPVTLDLSDEQEFESAPEV